MEKKRCCSRQIARRTALNSGTPAMLFLFTESLRKRARVARAARDVREMHA